MIQQEMGRASGISFYQYCTWKDFYVSENFKSEEEVGNL